MFNRAWLAGGISRTACVAAYEPICAVSLADSYINRANPGTYNAAPGTAPTWTAEAGWNFNGTSQYLKTGFIPSAGGSVLCRFSNRGAGLNQMVFGNLGGGSAWFYLAPKWDDVGPGRIYANGNNLSIPATLASGVMCVAGQAPYLDGARDGSGSISAWSGTGIESYVGAVNLFGGPYGYFGGNIQAIYIYNVPLTPTQVRAVTDAMNMLPMRPQTSRLRSWLATKRQIPGINKGPFIKGN